MQGGCFPPTQLPAPPTQLTSPRQDQPAPTLCPTLSVLQTLSVLPGSQAFSAVFFILLSFPCDPKSYLLCHPQLPCIAISLQLLELLCGLGHSMATPRHQPSLPRKFPAEASGMSPEPPTHLRVPPTLSPPLPSFLQLLEPLLQLLRLSSSQGKERSSLSPSVWDSPEEW